MYREGKFKGARGIYSLKRRPTDYYCKLKQIKKNRSDIEGNLLEKELEKKIINFYSFFIKIVN